MVKQSLENGAKKALWGVSFRTCKKKMSDNHRLSLVSEERKTGLGPATSTLARLRSTNWAISALHYKLSVWRTSPFSFESVLLISFIRERSCLPPLRMFVNLAISRSRCLYRIASAKICQKNYSPKLLWFFLRFYFNIFRSTASRQIGL